MIDLLRALGPRPGDKYSRGNMRAEVVEVSRDGVRLVTNNPDKEFADYVCPIERFRAMARRTIDSGAEFVPAEDQRAANAAPSRSALISG